VRAARERARVLLQRGEPFVWNATDTTRAMRRQLIDFFAGYGARVRVVYVDAPWEAIVERNRSRREHVPETVIARLLARFELPDATEAHTVEYIWHDHPEHNS
jgi:predicted kinase